MRSDAWHPGGLALGFAALLLGLLLLLVLVHIRSRRYFDRPAVARLVFFDPALLMAAAVVIFCGLLAIWRAWPTAGIAAAALLAAAGVYRAVIRSVLFQRWLLRRDYAALKRRHPDLPERSVLVRLLILRHPGWGEELVEQMVLDYPTFEDLGRVVALMERGFRGFR